MDCCIWQFTYRKMRLVPVYLKMRTRYHGYICGGQTPRWRTFWWPFIRGSAYTSFPWRSGGRPLRFGAWHRPLKIDNRVSCYSDFGLEKSDFALLTLLSVLVDNLKMFVNYLGLLCLALSSLVRGQMNTDIQNDPISVFVTTPGSGSGNYVFALNVPSNSEDIYFHLSGPDAYQWIAVGTGSEMKNSLMFIAYLNSTGNGLS